MKKITLLTLLFVCAIGFGQNKVSTMDKDYPFQKAQQTETVQKKAVILQQGIQDSSIPFVNKVEESVSVEKTEMPKSVLDMSLERSVATPVNAEEVVGIGTNLSAAEKIANPKSELELSLERSIVAPVHVLPIGQDKISDQSSITNKSKKTTEPKSELELSLERSIVAPPAKESISGDVTVIR